MLFLQENRKYWIDFNRSVWYVHCLERYGHFWNNQCNFIDVYIAELELCKSFFCMFIIHLLYMLCFEDFNAESYIEKYSFKT
jgi:hypothetical protein